ncbi:hypothetical protein NHX12_022533 [Muraenolepis orangiensis]|uniref:Uncharacterized protein n=1 Tax=Muraenolepis orangiensis TaxID=630683 RepID=A0A9Q0ER68_9TELE|nr:hypothetical protein NHX12_022533 [Muraenolepis orangiensis]
MGSRQLSRQHPRAKGDGESRAVPKRSEFIRSQPEGLTRKSQLKCASKDATSFTGAVGGRCRDQMEAEVSRLEEEIHPGHPEADTKS